ncbi:MAG: hypothetical protein MJZ15_03740 [Bacteroidales bacterium]|nr:hypothetical protein [Bacteroidales bacterium]
MTKNIYLITLLASTMCACNGKNEKTSEDETAHEIEVWKGVSKISWETGDFVQLPTSAFDSLSVGDELVADFNYVGDDPYPMVSLFDGEWDNLSGSGRISIDSTMTTVSYVVTKNMLESIQFSGLAFTGVAYELTGVKIVKHEAPENIENAVWYGSVKMADDWQTFVNVSEKTFFEAKPGDIMRIYFSEYKENSQCSSHTGKWESIAEHDVITNDHLDRLLTPELLELLRVDGYNINGSGFTVNRVEFIGEK